MVGVGSDAVRCSPRELCVTSPLPQVGARLLQFYHKWASVMENWFLLEVIWVGASVVFPVWPLLSSLYIPFSLPHEGNLKRDKLMAKVWAMVAKGAVIPLPRDPGPWFYCNLFLVTKVTGGYQPVINLKPLNRFLHNPHFKMETSQAIIKAVSPGD